jgi:hypothetical protein
MKDVISLLITSVCLAAAGLGVYLFSYKSEEDTTYDDDNNKKGGKKNNNTKNNVKNDYVYDIDESVDNI